MKKFGIYTLDSLDVAGKTVLLRVDINEPIDRAADRVTDDTRIRGCVPTIAELRDRGAKVVIMAHQGSDIEYKNYYTLRPHVRVLEQLLGSEVQFIADVCGPAAQDAIRGLQPGEVLLLDNVRFMAEEQTLFERSLKLTHEQQADTLVVRTLAPLADCYVCDAFAAAHRDQPTLCGFEQRLPSAMGRLFEKEYSVISSLMEAPARPCVFVLGGAKIADAFLMMQTVLDRGQNWVDRGIPYSMEAYTTGPDGRSYRTDCSGFVSMAYGLDQSYSTVTLPEHFTEINKDDLQPGDIIGNLGAGSAGAAGHVVIFTGWTDSSKTSFTAIEQTGGVGATSSTHTWGSSFWNNNAYRYNGF